MGESRWHRESGPGASTCRSGAWSARTSARPWGPRPAGGPGRSPPTTRTPPRWAWRRPAGRWPPPAVPVPKSSSSPPPSPPTTTRPTPPPSTPPWASPAGRRLRLVRLGALGRGRRAAAAVGRPRPPGAGRGRRPADGPRRRAPTSATRATVPPPSRSCPTGAVAELVGPGGGHRGVPRPVAGARASRLPASGRSASARQVYVPLAQAAFADALKQAGITAEAVDHLVVTGLHARAVRAVRTPLGVAAEALVADLAADGRQPGRGPARRARWPTCSSGPTPGQMIVTWSAGRRRRRRSSCGPPTPCRRSRRARRAGLATRGRPGGGRAAPICLRAVPHLAGPAAPRAAAPARPRSPRRARTCCASKGGSSASTPAAAWPAASATCRPPGCACTARRSTRWSRSGWPTCRGTVATFTIDRLAFSHVAAHRRASSSTSTAAAATAAR